MDDVKFVSIPEKEYRRLLKKSNFLCCLENQGVDNWNGYGYAHEEYEEQYGEEFY